MYLEKKIKIGIRNNYSATQRKQVTFVTECSSHAGILQGIQHFRAVLFLVFAAHKASSYFRCRAARTMGKFLGCVWDYWPPLASFEQNTYVRLISLSAFWSWTESRHNSWPRFSRNCRRKSAPFKFGLFSLWIMNAASPAISTILKKNARGQCNVLRFRF